MISTGSIPDFQIKPVGIHSEACLSRHISTFSRLCSYVWELPYRRNKDKDNLTTVFTDNCGTCSTKHALLKQVASENHADDIQLVLSIFKMSTSNTPKVAKVLKSNGIDYIPEAHTYIKYKGIIHDFTGEGFIPRNYENDILEELIISPGQINAFKIAYHKNYLRNWFILNNKPDMTFDALWEAREACIAALAGH